MNQEQLKQIAASLKANEQSQVRVLTGTVSGPSTDPKAVPVRLDNDQSSVSIAAPVVIPSVCGTIPTGTRVMIFSQPPAGMFIVGTLDTLYGLAQRETSNVWGNPRVYTTTDLWLKPDSQLFMGVTVQCQGAGGGSGATTATAAQTSSSGGGQGGAYVEATILAASLPSAVTAQVGLGGLAGAAPGGNGGPGQASVFIDLLTPTTFVSAPGGSGGSGGGAAAGAQTTQSGGNGAQLGAVIVGGGAAINDIRVGDDGGTGFRIGSGATGIIMPGFGGSSRMAGIRRVQSLAGGQIDPAVGYLYGGGASGGATNGTLGALNGAAGADGIVIVTEWYRT